MKFLHIFFAILILASTKPASANLLEIIQYNNLTESLKDKEYELKNDDENLVLNLLRKDEKIMHYNLGVLYLKQNKPEAKKQFKYVLEKQNNATDEAKLNSAFNMGTLLSEEKKIDEAISYYQKVLDIDPNHVEAKHNIEFLLQQSNNQSKEESEDQPEKQSDDQENSQSDTPTDNQSSNQEAGDGKNQPLPNQHLSDKEEEAILNELLRQENKIRMRQKHQIKPTEKDW